MKGRAAVLSVAVFLVAASVCFRGLSSAYQTHQVFFQNTDYELNIYRIYGDEPGKTLLIIGGIQGNEPGGYLAADLYVEASLKRGNLIVVPRANFVSIVRNVRGVNGDMNRKFAGLGRGDRDRLVIEKLKELIQESDFLLNLHDGSGFYADTWISDQRNPKRYGQSVIADCETFFSQRYSTSCNLGAIARRICEKVNSQIVNEEFFFHFNNHKTSAVDTIHPEQRRSATYFAVKQHEIPAFGIETSKCISSAKERVRYQAMVINAFMEEFGVVPKHPGIALPDPAMNYLIATVNGATPVAVYNGETLYLNKGDLLTIIHVEANYERGITANIPGTGFYNDMRKQITVNRETEVVVKKDNLTCGEVSIKFAKRAEVNAAGRCRVDYLIVTVNDSRVAVCPGEHLSVCRGDVLVIQDLVAPGCDAEGFKVNFKGFVGNRRFNDGEDRGYPIHTDGDLMSRYAQDSAGTVYPVVVKKGSENAAVFFVDISKSAPGSM